MELTDYQSERKVLSGATHSEKSCIEVITQLNANDFTDPLHKEIFNLMVAIYTDGTFPSYGIFVREAMKYGLLDSASRNEQIKSELTDWGYTDNIQYWIDQVVSSAKARGLSSILDKYHAVLSDRGAKDIDDTLAAAIDEMSQIDLGRSKDEFEDGKQIAQQIRTMIDERTARYQEAQLTGEVNITGIPTGFAKLDLVTLGYKPGNLIVLAAKTGQGKTAFALQTAKTVAVDYSKPLLYVNTEMSKEQIHERLCGVISGVPLYSIKQGSLSPGDQLQVDRAIEAIGKSGFIHVQAPHLTPVHCVMLGKRARIQNKVEMIMVDYIGRMEKYDPKVQEWQVLEQVAKAMKLLAQELKIPVIVLAQLNDDGSLQGSKRIKNECDLFMKLVPLEDKTEEKEEFDRKYKNANYKLVVDKNRDGEANKKIALRYEKPVQQITEALPVEDKWADIGKYAGGEGVIL